jgi:hypothetical protein
MDTEVLCLKQAKTIVARIIVIITKLTKARIIKLLITQKAKLI